MRQMRLVLLIVAMVVLGLGTLAGTRQASALTEQEELVQRATIAVTSLKNFNDVGVIRPYIKGARAVVIIPSFVKAGFIVGGAHGEGVIIGRNTKTGAWRYPAFISLTEGSLGLQIGVDESEIMMVVLTEKGMNALLHNGVKLGAEAGIAILTIGAGREGSTTTAVGADVVTFARSKGLFAGLSIEGAVLSQDQAANTVYHGKAYSTKQLVTTDVRGNRGADGLRSALGGY
ncbi:MAG: lipid-binding SYLF domain-containing protein [Alphaproteobacteria bacterium]|nr:lipid-binding SYLF domain-containing protein [Alphaproteobacteria bacterium]